MKKIISIITIFISCFLSIAQSQYEIKSSDGKIIARHFKNPQEGLDSIVIKNNKHNLKLSRHTPFFKFEDKKIVKSIYTNQIEKINNNIYMLKGVGTLNWETQLHFIFFKKNKILKYYLLISNDRQLRSESIHFKYLSKTNEVIIPIIKRYTPLNYIYDINIKENKLDSILALEQPKSSKYHKYKLKVK
jgi:hypothetical protein